MSPPNNNERPNLRRMCQMVQIYRRWKDERLDKQLSLVKVNFFLTDNGLNAFGSVRVVARIPGTEELAGLVIFDSREVPTVVDSVISGNIRLYTGIVSCVKNRPENNRHRKTQGLTSLAQWISQSDKNHWSRLVIGRVTAKKDLGIVNTIAIIVCYMHVKKWLL